ncbi:TPA: molecular chaperone [Klebsiella aerogenes]|nr:molecular chaperone [Klebsiella aerogenes]
MYTFISVIKKIKTTLVICILISNFANARSEGVNGISFNFTRLVLTDKDKNGVTFKAHNSNPFPVLIQAWSSNLNTITGSVLDSSSSEEIPFIVLPPLQRVEPDEDFILRVRFNGKSIKENSESVYLLSFKAIPISKSSSDNELLMTVVTNLKVFIRNKLHESGGVSSVAHKISSFWVPEGIIIKNPTPYWLTLSSMKVDKMEIDKELLLKMVEPMSSTLYKWEKAKPKEIQVKFIDEYSMDTPSINLKVE